MAVRDERMRRLYLLRHAKSSWDDPSLGDFDRPLNDRGRQAARSMGRHLGEAGIRPDVVLCSAAVRTRQTLEALAPALGGIATEVEETLYEANQAELMARLRRLDDGLVSVLLIAHNPGLERLARALVAGRGEASALARLAEKFPTGALAVVETDLAHWADLDEGCGRLAGFVRPKDLE